MPGPALPAIVAGGLAAARGARSLYKVAKPFIRKEIKDFNEYMPGMLPLSGAAATYGTIDAVSGGKTKDRSAKLPDTIVRGRNSNPSDFSRKPIK